ncbi:unnamed protein product, partial [Ectocarpus fasciculatus]
ERKAPRQRALEGDETIVTRQMRPSNRVRVNARGATPAETRDSSSQISTG